MPFKRVLILSEGFGSGHTQAAHALAAGLQKVDPHIQAKVLELGSVLNPTLAPWILSAYRITVTTSPALVGLFYRKKYEKPVGRLTRLALHKLFYNHAAGVIGQMEPDLIICTHPIPGAIISRLKASGLDVPLYTLITDYDAHGSWISPEVDRYFVSTPEVRSLLIQRGVKPAAIQVSGIPVHPEFWIRQDKASVRRELGLKNIPTVLIMGGGWGILKDELIERLSQWKKNVQIVCCMGSNEKLVAKLRNHPGLQHSNIRVLAYTREISKWMDASDLLITKPGGMTCTEGLAKGIPMLFYECIPGQEDKNRDYFIKIGCGNELTSTEILDFWFAKISSDRTAYTGSYTELRRSPDTSFYRPDLCARNIADLLEDPAESSLALELSRQAVGQAVNYHDYL
ncbi:MULTISPECIES: MGDG synthase family glycosyltransferase [Paenibacillus]|uniref:UDP-glucuronosyltransferase n=1 Tax=Paenibacillus vini TaxID=1476024 RepID=A0ABQ4MDE3_9BACL|nr:MULTISPECIES: glycosyltransferase [Paenibacillus]MBQ4899198.1 UDP-N-acetylglucosamine--LPS N-acetylglucosamine transferase [Paenibacillus sp. Marseille-P2973]GIP54021.1 UDP-glucuronosyltransferase [Paenibacillus vini]